MKESGSRGESFSERESDQGGGSGDEMRGEHKAQENGECERGVWEGGCSRGRVLAVDE